MVLSTTVGNQKGTLIDTHLRHCNYWEEVAVQATPEPATGSGTGLAPGDKQSIRVTRSRSRKFASFELLAGSTVLGSWLERTKAYSSSLLKLA